MSPWDAPRVGRTPWHPFTDRRGIAVRAVLGGADHGVAIALLGRWQEAGWRTLRARPHGIPSHATFERGFAPREADPWAARFRAGVPSPWALTAGHVVPIDGQGVRGSQDPAPNLGPRPRVRAWAHTPRRVRAPMTGNRQSHAITAHPRREPAADSVPGGKQKMNCSPSR